MLGVFMALDFFLFYVFWEVMLLPMYFLIGIWGGPRREYAAIKFFLFTLVGSVLMLVAMLMLYFDSDLHMLSDAPTGRLPRRRRPCADGRSRAFSRSRSTRSISWRWPRSASCTNSPFNATLLWGQSLAWWAFLLLFIGFVIKLPAVPVHTWLPDAHVEAPTPISMILAGVLLKMGGYGILRICYPICPDAGYELAWLVCGLGVVSMVYGAFAALAQKDFKRLVAYSSVSHMGYVLLGHRRVERRRPATQYNTDYWTDGHERGDVPDDRPRHQLGWHVLPGRRGLRPRAPPRPRPVRRPVRARCRSTAAFRWASSSPRLGLPGLCGFIGEVFVVLGGVELQHGAGGGRRLGGDPHGRLHPVDDPAGVPGAGVQGPARRGPHADDPPRSGHRRAAVGAWRSCSACIRRRCSTT